MSAYDAPPPTKASLLRWWKAFIRNSSPPRARRPTPVHAYQPPGRGLAQGKDGKGRVFGVSPDVSLQYASVAISMVGPDEKAYVYGYVPIVVAKCGLHLKETATQIEGIFRVSGSSKRINELQAIFDSPPRYGKDLDWQGYSVHDAASVLRRYLNQMPEPVIPANLYLDFTAVLQRQLLESEAIAEYQRLITLLPPASRYLLLYLLDFLSVFVRSSSANLMTASNLAVVFQPGLVSTRREGTGRGGSGGEGALLGFPGFVDGRIPDRSAGAGAKAIEGAGEHGRGKEVLEFLIEQQASFMLGLEPPLKGGGGRRGKEQEGTEDSGYGNSGSSPGSSGGVATPKGTARGPATAALGADLSRRGSEKSVERRRLRKSHDGENGKVKRSRTLPVNGGVSGREGSEGIYPSSSSRPSALPFIPSSPGSPSPNPNPRARKPRREPPTPSPQSHPSQSSSPETDGSPCAVHTAPSGGSDTDAVSRPWSPKWMGKKTPGQ